MKRILAVAAAFAAFSASAVPPQDSPAGEQHFRELYKELVETNTTLSAGSCTLAAERMAARLKAAGFPDGDLHPFAAPDHPKEGGLVAIYPGKDPQLKAILLLAHIDVVEAKREDWTRDPFKLVEENGSFYARGASDDKAEAAIWVDTLIRYRTEKYRPRRTLKLALTCGEETAGAFNGADWLTRNRRDLIDAAFALNEGAAGELDQSGHRVALEIEAGEKFPQNYRLEVTNKGGHSSRPVKDNAIYRLAAALMRIGAYEFPAQFTDGNRAYFAGMAKILAAKGDTETANAMNAFLKDPNDRQALALVSAKDPSWNATLRTTCVATMLDAGHATNALPQRARANVNCRIFPGVSADSVRAKLEELVADAAVKISSPETRGPTAAPPALTPEIMAPIEKLTAEFWPGVPVLPVLQAGATDGEFTNAVGIPTFGFEPVFIGPDLGNIHGLNEYVGVKSLLEGREFLYRLIKIYAEQKR
ncbi:MAG TPA: M20/M25/M40 family metallo-hydrolase [Steroidobacteraceae bacterium]|jgi:acetylornithine deacetylase/succinyl-diaminopimelate desuccinylase-like protein|nr:M20/M25/M40 family metallo-hydrolase [Steroidobacteraceae bacterium]